MYKLPWCIGTMLNCILLGILMTIIGSSAIQIREHVFDLDDEDDQLKDVICKSSCRYLQVNGYLWSKDNAFLKKLCRATVDAYSPQCMPKALGMENGDIPDSSITASSFYESVYRPEQGRLNFKGNGQGINPAWEPLEAKQGEWIQMDLGDEMKVTAVATQGNGKWKLKEWTKCYTLQYSNDGQHFEDYDGGRVFLGNNDRDTVVKNRIDPPIIARYIRVVPKTWKNWNALRLELYGCSSAILGKLRSSTNTCTERPLGMESGVIPDSSITASSYYHSKDSPHEARLNNKYKNRLASGVWIVAYDKPGSWIQVDLGDIKTVSGIATQGKPNYPGDWDGYIKTYKLAHSHDSQVFAEYLKGVVFDGNTDRNTVVKHDLIPVIRARYIRIYPQTWYRHIALRFELYGCGKGNPLRQESIVPDNDKKQETSPKNAMSSTKPTPTQTKPHKGISWRRILRPFRCSRSLCGGIYICSESSIRGNVLLKRYFAVELY